MLFDTMETLNSMLRNGHKLSWSKKNWYDSCPVQWFVSMAKPLESETLMQENTFALPGWVIQKLLETFINHRVYNRPEMISIQSLYDWFDSNLGILTEFIMFDTESQKYMGDVRGFFKLEGKNLVDSAYKNGLDRNISGFQPMFIKPDVFIATHKNMESLISRMSDIIHRVIDMWAKNGMNLNLVTCESFISSTIEGFAITGLTDYIYNVNGVKEIEKGFDSLEDGYILTDGKFNISRYVHEEQLQLYQTLIRIITGKTAGKIRFLDYNKTSYKEMAPDLHYYEKLVTDLCKIEQTYQRVLSFVRGQNRTFDILDIPENFTPSMTGCSFCSYKNSCEAYQKSEWGKDFFTIHNYKLEKDEQVKEFAGNGICEFTLDETKTPQSGLKLKQIR